MERTVGSHAAEALVRVGLGRDDVVRALMKEVGVSVEEAEAAWDYASAVRV